MESGNPKSKSQLHSSLQAIYDQQVIHYAKMAMCPATLDHARYMVKQLMNEPSGMFKNLGADVKAKIDENKSRGVETSHSDTDQH